MKKISTLGFGVLISLASFAQHGNDRSLAFGGGRAAVKVTIAGNGFDRHPGFAEARINVQPARAYNDHGRTNDPRRDDRGYGNDRNYNNNFHGGYIYGNRRAAEAIPIYNYGYNSSSIRIISNEDFFAAGRVMDRENDRGRLMYAERLVDENYLCAEQ